MVYGHHKGRRQEIKNAIKLTIPLLTYLSLLSLIYSSLMIIIQFQQETNSHTPRAERDCNIKPTYLYLSYLSLIHH